ncbi:MAG TPA: hypothetical protein VFJ06_01890 [Halococcus sp.]|nr:hypothetical protein [Halococcus sp.]
MPDRDGSGRFESKLDADDVAEFIRDANRPFQTTRDVAEQFAVDQSTAYRKLQHLTDDGRLNKTQVSANAVVWWMSDTGKMEGISRRHGDDEYSENPDWVGDLPGLGDGA